jgi:agmatinase
MRPPRPDRARIVLWPFPLFGNPGGEAGIEALHGALEAALADHAAEPSSRQHALAARTRLEMRSYVQLEDLLGWRAEVRRELAKTLRRGEFPVFIGANHLVALPIYEALGESDERVLVVNLDAHLDAYDLASSREPLNHGNFLLHLPKGPRLSIVNVGHRDLTLGRAAIEAVFDRDYAIDEVVARGMAAVVADLKKRARGADRVWVDIDLDVLDPGVLRAVGTPMPFGLSSQQLLELLGGLLSPKLAGISISEYSAAADADGSGRHLVVWLLEHLLLRRLGSR